MNRVFKVIWNTALNRYDVVPEFIRAGKKSKSSTSLSTNTIVETLLVASLGMFSAGAAWSLPLPAIIVSSEMSENDVQRDSATGPAVVVTYGGVYTGDGVTITSQAPSSGGNMSALYVTSGGEAYLDANSIVTMSSSSAPTVCCTYGIVADGAGSKVVSSATVIGSTGGAGAYNGGGLELNGGSLSGLFGIVSSGTGSAIYGNNVDISGSGGGTGVRAELGGSVFLEDARVLANGITADGNGSYINVMRVEIAGMVNAHNGGTIYLDSGSVTNSGLGSYGLLADGSADSFLSSSANVTVTGGGSAAVARNGATLDVYFSNLSGDAYGVYAVEGSQVTIQGATVTSNSTGLYVADNDTNAKLDYGYIIANGANSTAVSINGAGAVFESAGGRVIGSGANNIGVKVVNGGRFIMDYSSVVSGGQTGLYVDGSASTAVTSGGIGGGDRAVYATNGGTVTLDGRGATISTKNNNAASSAILADNGGVVNMTDGQALTYDTVVRGNGIQVASGGQVNLAGGTLSVTGSNVYGLRIDGASAAITSSAPFTIQASGVSSKALTLTNGAIHTFQNLTATANASNGNAIQSVAGDNQLTLTDSTFYATQGQVVTAASGSLTLAASNTQMTGSVFIKDNGNIINITASDASVLGGTAQATNSSVILDSGSQWNVGAGSSTLGSLVLDNATMKSAGAGSMNVSNNILLDAGGGTFNTNNFDTLYSMNTLTGAGSLTKQGLKMLTISGGVDYTGNTLISGGTLRFGAGIASGNVHLNHVDNNAALIINRPDLVTIDMIEGTGTVEQYGTGTTVLWNDNTDTGRTTVTNGILQLGNGGNTGSVRGDIEVGSNGVLSIVRDGHIVLGNKLTGLGLIKTNTAGQAFDFAASTGNAFAGTLAVDKSTFMLDGVNTVALSHATLRTDTNSTTTVGNGNQAIGGLAFNGGQVNFDTAIPNAAISPAFIQVAGQLDASGTGKIRITKDGYENATVPVVNKTLSLLDQQKTLAQLASAQTAIGGAGALQLIDQNGNAISNVSMIAISQNGVHAADATYDYRLVTHGDKGDGLYVGYGITQLDLLTNDTDKLLIDTAYSTEKTLSAKVIGSGDLGIAAGNGADALIIANVTNSYTGETDLQTGTLILGTDNALGQTSKLSLADNTTANINGKTQTIEELTTNSSSMLDLNGGDLTLLHGGQVDGNLTGAGQLTLTGDTLVLSQNNSTFTGTTDIQSGVTARLTQSQGLGQGGINNEGTLNLDGAVGTMLNSLKGTNGDVLLTQGADITLNGNSTDYAGTFTTTSGTTLTGTAAEQLGTSTVHNDGTFVMDTAGQWAMNNTVDGSGTLVKRGTGTVQLDGNNVSAGLTRIENGLLLVGATPGSASDAILTSDVIIAEQGTLGGYGQVVGNVDNSGNLTLGRALTKGTPGEFTINGNYTGNNGTVTFNTDLEGDDSATDKLIITGDTAGQSQVVVLSARSEGAQTVDGIKLIEVDGSSNGAFTLKGRAVAGAYEYYLNKGGVSAPDDGNWYLRSVLPDPVNPTPANNVIRPEAGSYMANMAAASKLFNLRLEDREGRAENSSMWLRQQGDRTKFRDNSGQIKTATNTYVIQGGGEVAQTQFSSADRLGIGLMLGYGKSNSESGNSRTDYHSKGSVDGYSGGVYATWYQDAKTLNGLYVDSWMQYSLLNATVKGDQLSGESYDMSGLSASVESGYRIPVYQGEFSNVFVTPQAQITWNGIKADDHREINGTCVTSDGNNNVQTRLGVKLSRDGVSDMDKGSDKLFTVYAEANWLHNTERAGATMDGVSTQQAGSTNVGELKVGAEGQLNKHVNLWTNVAQQMGDDGYSDTALTVGFKYKF